MAMYAAKGTLIRLSDRDLLTADSAEDMRGRMLLDTAREDLGEVDDLFIDDHDHRGRFLKYCSQLSIVALIRAGDGVCWPCMIEDCRLMTEADMHGERALG